MLMPVVTGVSAWYTGSGVGSGVGDGVGSGVGVAVGVGEGEGVGEGDGAATGVGDWAGLVVGMAAGVGVAGTGTSVTLSPRPLTMSARPVQPANVTAAKRARTTIATSLFHTALPSLVQWDITPDYK